MLNLLGRITTLRSKTVLFSSLIFALASLLIGVTAIGGLTGGGYQNPGSDSAKVFDILESDFEAEEPHLTIAVGKKGVMNAVLSEDVVSSANAMTARISDVKGVSEVVSFWQLPENLQPQFQSQDGTLGLIFVYINPESLDLKNQIARDVDELIPAKDGDVEYYVGGAGAIYNAINGQISRDIYKAELISIPLTMILLLIVFGAVIAAGMPLIVGLTSIAISLFGLWVVSRFTEVSVFALNLITGLGLGLGIDYSLLIVNRFREELAKGLPSSEAVKRTLKTAGKTVVYSGVTVALTLSSMVLFPQPFLQSFAYAGVLVCLTAVFGAIVPLAATLNLLGEKINRFEIRGLRRRKKNAATTITSEEQGFWANLADFVMRRPWMVATLTTLGLLALMSLALNVNFSQIDDRALPKNNPAAIAAEVFRQEFTSNETSPVEIIVPKGASYDALAEEVSNLTNIVRVETPTGIFQDGVFIPITENWPPVKSETDSYQRLRAIIDLPARTLEAKAVIEEIRLMSDDALVGGVSADFADSQNGITDNLSRVLLWVALMTFIVLFLFTGSILLPIKAVVLNIISLGATLGVLTWIFEYGNLMWLTGEYTVTGNLDTSSIVLVAIVTFGLSMDYELFLLSRIKEEHDAGKDTVTAVKIGLQKSGRIITAAALLLAVVFAAFVTSGVTNMKMLGFGIAFAILLDATVVRGLLVPAFMRIANSWNWWAPKPLARLHQRYGLKED